MEVRITQNVSLVERLIYDVLDFMEVVRVELTGYLGRPSNLLRYHLTFSSGYG